MDQFPSVEVDQDPSVVDTGFIVTRMKGSHPFLRHGDGRATVVPVHAGETIRTGVLASMPRDCELTREALAELL